MDIEGEAVIEEDLGSSDIEVLGESKPKRGNLKKPHRKDKPRKPSVDEDIDDFIEPETNRARQDSRVKRPSDRSLFEIPQQEPVVEQPKANLFDQAQIEEHYATNKDMAIKNTDIPERLQRLSEE
jgi:hypothetical protein